MSEERSSWAAWEAMTVYGTEQGVLNSPRDEAKTRDYMIREQPQDPELNMPKGYFRWNLGPDEALMQLVDYANIACGFHAGDYNTMVRTVRAAIKYGVKMGAHPGLDDVKGFGRRKIDVSPDDIYASTLYQLGALKAIIEAEGGKFSHVKVGPFTSADYHPHTFLSAFSVAVSVFILGWPSLCLSSNVI
jgi:hypothetical protein